MLAIFHASAVCLYSFAIWYDQQYVDVPFPVKEYEHVPLKGRAIFFTFWSLVLQTLYFIVALLNDFIGSNAATKKPPFIRKIKDVLFSITLTTALYVVLVFWAFYVFDKTLLFHSEEAELKFPKWLNHVMHTLILPVILVELLITKRNYPSKNTGFSICIFLTAIYATYIHVIYFKYGIWPYPFLFVVSWTTKTMYFIGSAILGMSFYLFGEKLDSIVPVNYRPGAHTNGTKKKH